MTTEMGMVRWLRTEAGRKSDLDRDKALLLEAANLIEDLADWAKEHRDLMTHPPSRKRISAVITRACGDAP